MTIKYLPILPPNLRPIVKLQDNTIITTDLNFFYSKIIDSNNKIIKLRKMSVPENFLNNEKLILQENVDKLISNESKKNAKTTNMRIQNYLLTNKDKKLKDLLLKISYQKYRKDNESKTKLTKIIIKDNTRKKR